MPAPAGISPVARNADQGHSQRGSDAHASL